MLLQEGASLTISASLFMFQLLRSNSVAVSTSHDFEDKATITAFLSKPIAHRFSVFLVYSGLETGAPAYTCAQSQAVCLNISGFCLYWFATTASCGSSGSTAASSACNDNNTVRRVIAAAHWSFRISKQIAPVTELILGCHILVINRTLGGLNGYVSGILISSWYLPPSYGVSGGPAISPLISVKFSSTRSTLKFDFCSSPRSSAPPWTPAWFAAPRCWPCLRPQLSFFILKDKKLYWFYQLLFD